MALDGIGGYREHVALVFETAALTFVLMAYLGALLGLFLHTSHKGSDPNLV